MNICDFVGEDIKTKKKNTIKKQYTTIKDICTITRKKIEGDKYYSSLCIKCLVKRVNVYKYCTFVNVTDVNVKAQYSPSICATISAYIFKNDVHENDVLILEGNIMFDPNRGEIKFRVKKYTFDSPQISNYEKVKEKLKKDGILDIKKKDIPNYIRNLAIISSDNAAGLKDCINMLQNGSCCNIYLYHSVVQGKDVEKGITENIKIINDRLDIDVILIIRGGGAKTDLEWFDNYNIACEVKKSKIPIVCGIGHEIDNTILDIVADYSCTTPTQVGHYILEKLLNRIRLLDNVESHYGELINRYIENVERCNSYIISFDNMISSNLNNKVLNLVNDYNSKVNSLTESIYSVNELIQEGYKNYDIKLLQCMELDNIFEKRLVNVHQINESIVELINTYSNIKITSGRKHIHTKSDFIKLLKSKKKFKIKFIDGDISLDNILKFI